MKKIFYFVTVMSLIGCGGSGGGSSDEKPFEEAPDQSQELITVELNFNLDVETGDMNEASGMSVMSAKASVNTAEKPKAYDFLSQDNYLIYVDGILEENIPAFTLDEVISIQVYPGSNLKIISEDIATLTSEPVSSTYTVEGEYTVSPSDTDINIKLSNTSFGFVSLAQENSLSNVYINGEEVFLTNGFYQGFVNIGNYELKLITNSGETIQSKEILANEHQHWVLTIEDKLTLTPEDEWVPEDIPLEIPLDEPEDLTCQYSVLVREETMGKQYDVSDDPSVCTGYEVSSEGYTSAYVYTDEMEGFTLNQLAEPVVETDSSFNFNINCKYNGYDYQLSWASHQSWSDSVDNFITHKGLNVFNSCEIQPYGGAPYKATSISFNGDFFLSSFRLLE